MKTLFERLSSKHQASFKTESVNFKISQSIAKTALQGKTNWLDLTICECDTVSVVLTGKCFRETSQMAELFN